MATYEFEMSARRSVWCTVTVEAEDEDTARHMAIEEAGNQSKYDWESGDEVDDIEIDTVRVSDEDEVDE